MGFRNPITSAAGLDTGGDGQRIVIDQHGGFEGGGAVLLYPADGSPPGSLEAQTDSFGPYVHLLSPTGTNGHRSGLQLHPDEAYLHTQGDFITTAKNMWVGNVQLLRRRAWNFPRVSGGPFDQYPANGVVQAVIAGTIASAPPGDYFCAVTVVMQGSAQSIGNTYLVANGAEVLGGPRTEVTTAAQAQTITCTVEDHPGGDLPFEVRQVYSGGQTITIWAGGSGLRVAYLGGRREFT